MRKEKQYLIDDLKERIEHSKAFIVAKYTKVTANAMSEFRNIITDADSDFEVIAKRVFVKAAVDQGIELSPKDLDGHIGVVFPKEDFLGAAKAVYKYGKDTDQSVDILAGFYEGKIYDRDSVIQLSKLPSKDEMRAQVLGLLEAPMAQTLATFEAILTSIIHCLDNKAKLEKS